MARILRFVFFLLIGLFLLGVSFPYLGLLAGVAALILALLEVMGGG